MNTELPPGYRFTTISGIRLHRAEDPLSNLERVREWRLRMNRNGYSTDVSAHCARNRWPIDWNARRPCRADDAVQIARGRIQLDGRGYLPRNYRTEDES